MPEPELQKSKPLPTHPAQPFSEIGCDRRERPGPKSFQDRVSLKVRKMFHYICTTISVPCVQAYRTRPNGISIVAQLADKARLK